MLKAKRRRSDDRQSEAGTDGESRLRQGHRRHGLAQLALTFETIAAETYQAETSMLKSWAAMGLSSSIQPVEMQHIAILYYVLGDTRVRSSSGAPLRSVPPPRRCEDARRAGQR